jgi:hypothetical protein
VAEIFVSVFEDRPLHAVHSASSPYAFSFR